MICLTFIIYETVYMLMMPYCSKADIKKWRNSVSKDRFGISIAVIVAEHRSKLNSSFLNLPNNEALQKNSKTAQIFFTKQNENLDDYLIVPI